ncbi:MAG: efflux RND transporter periplasmic adaptor subunit [Sedimentisphaerales bacterium]|jgi:multidrug resistance efflux pump|nr:efflux RND transporter periplasmic adaptor subunit [Sedimentisphaerales bacterium]
MVGRRTRNHTSRNSNLHQLVHLAVWICTLVVVAGLFYHRTTQIAMFGVVQGRIFEVGTTCPGRIVSIPVSLYQNVTEGQTVAVVNILRDDHLATEAQLRSQLETISAQIQHLAAQLIPTQEQILAETTRSESTRAENLRRFAADVDNARLRVLELRAQIETDRMAAAALEPDIKITSKLVEANAVAPIELERLQMQHKALLAKIEENAALLEQAQQNLHAAQQRLESFAAMTLEHSTADYAVEVIRKEIAVQERLMDEVSAQLEAIRRQQAFEIKAPADGVVVQIAMDVGHTVDVNLPILRIAQANPTDVIGYAEEAIANRITAGMQVRVIRRGPPPAICTGQVISVGPVVEQMPVQLWRNRNVPQWGRPFLVRTSGQMDLLVGERVGIKRL